jgi:two-component system, chemotaxis family, CheB/CheR fusion protein
MVRNKKRASKNSTANPEASLPETLSADAVQKKTASSFPIVGIGASAGGLAAFEAFFSGMPADEDPDMAFVLVQHLAPNHKSILSDLVSRYTRMQVFEVVDGMKVKPNCAYIIPPNRDMAFLNGALQLLEPSSPRGMRLPIDYFFRTLAADQRERAICLVLSGTGSDGTLGVRAIKGEGGMVMVQDPETTSYDSMPRNAIASGLVDFVLPPDKMAAQLIGYARHAFNKPPRSAPAIMQSEKNFLQKVCVLLRDHTGHDFSHYKPSTLVRRVERRMSVHQLEDQEAYLRLLQQNPEEGLALFRDLLIGVTNFFRDPEAFSALSQDVIDPLLARAAGNQVRIWVCGCSTGEEAYSIAILLQEQLENLKRSFKVQLFATDLDRRVIESARSGIFPASIANDISSERLTRFFTHDPVNGNYQIQKSIRDMLVFSEHDLIKDPPFSRLDLISCRNLLIYLTGEIQNKVIPLFHYALNPGGVLFLGPSETIGDNVALFKPLNREWKIYQKRDDVAGAAVRPGLRTLAACLPPAGADKQTATDGAADLCPGARELVDQTLLKHYVQSALLVDGRGQILHIYGRTGMYLEPSEGEPGLNILTMAREGLAYPLTTALQNAVSRNAPAYYPGLQVKTNGTFVSVNLIVQPAISKSGQTPADRYLVILEQDKKGHLPCPPIPSSELTDLPAEDEGTMQSRMAECEQRLHDKDEYLRATIEEMQTSNEELKSTNEELQSVNEELQSTNEELETSKEELQSVNEELSTVNSELQTKLSELSRANNDMNNLLSGTGIATLFVDHKLQIIRFTPSATQLINLIQSDVGRPVGHIVSNLIGYNKMVEDIRGVLHDLVPREAEVRTPSGNWFLMRIRPYRTMDNVIEGAVLTFVDISELKQARDNARNAQKVAEKVLDTLKQPVVVLDASKNVLLANEPFCAACAIEQRAVAGKKLDELGNRMLEIPALHELIEKVVQERSAVENCEISADIRSRGRIVLTVSARYLDHLEHDRAAVLLTIHDLGAPVISQADH